MFEDMGEMRGSWAERLAHQKILIRYPEEFENRVKNWSRETLERYAAKIGPQGELDRLFCLRYNDKRRIQYEVLQKLLGREE